MLGECLGVIGCVWVVVDVWAAEFRVALRACCPDFLLATGDLANIRWLVEAGSAKSVLSHFVAALHWFLPRAGFEDARDMLSMAAKQACCNPISPR